MIPLLVKQSVQRKMEFGASKLLGVYEFYYSVGFLYGKLGMERPKDLANADALKAALAKKSGSAAAGDEKLRYLLEAVAEHSPEKTGEAADDIVTLFEEGMTDGFSYG